MLALLVMGSATLLFSCGDESDAPQYDYETIMTERSENRTITMTENGKRSYSFFAPLIEGYSLAQNPYQVFQDGIKMTTYTSDSLSLVDATITADYAIYYDKQKLWGARNNVVIIKYNRAEGDTVITGKTEVYTEQLFWDARTKKIYSNVQTEVVQDDGRHMGEGFEADEDLKNIHFRKYKSEMEFDFTPMEETPEEAEARKKTEEEKQAKANKSTSPKRPGRTSPAQRPSINPMSSATTSQSKSTKPSTTPTRPTATKPKNNTKPNSTLSTSMSLDGVQRPTRPNRGATTPAPKQGANNPTSRTTSKPSGTHPSSSANNPKSVKRDAPKSATITKQ